MTRVLALAGQSKIGLSRSGGSPKSGPKPIRNGVPLWTETACRFPPKPRAGLNRNRLSETSKFAGDQAHSAISGNRPRKGSVMPSDDYARIFNIVGLLVGLGGILILFRWGMPFRVESHGEI